MTIASGDLVLVRAAAGHVRAGAHAVDLVGVYVTALLREDGEVMAPLGAPNWVVFIARAPGRAVVDVVTNDPWGSSEMSILNVLVQEPD